MFAGMGLSCLSGAARSVCDREGQQRDVARAPHGQLHLALMTRAVAADTSGNDLATLRDEILERLRVLVVDDERLLGAVPAHPALAPPAPDLGVEVGAAGDVPVVVHHRHGYFSSSPSFSPAAAALGAPSSGSSAYSSTSSGRRMRGASGPGSMRPSCFSRDSSFSSSGGGSILPSFVSSGSIWRAATSTASAVCTVMNLRTASWSARLRSTSATSPPPPTYFR